ncbi:UNVERIFIED_CONTAM: hypothetical protein ACS92_02735 [Bacillus cereus]
MEIDLVLDFNQFFLRNVFFCWRKELVESPHWKIANLDVEDLVQKRRAGPSPEVGPGHHAELLVQVRLK